MASLFTVPTNSFFSSSISRSYTFQPPPSLLPLYSPFQSHEIFPVINFASAITRVQNSSLSFLGFRPLHLPCRQITSISSSSVPLTKTDNLFRLFQEIGLNEKETELLLEKNPDLIIKSFDSISKRILSLKSLGLGVNGFELTRLITKCPDVLTATEIDSVVSFIKSELEGMIEPAQLEKFLVSTDPRFLVGFDRKVLLLLHHGIPQEKLAHVLNSVNLTKAICLKSLEEIDRMLSYLNRFGGADIIVRRPVILNYDLDTQLVPKIKFLTELGGGEAGAAGALLRKLPAILSYSLEHLDDHVEFLRSYAGLENEEIFKIFLVFPNVISASRKRKLHPRIEFLKQCGLKSNDIFKFLVKAPLFLGLSFDNINCKLGLLVKIGYRYKTKELAAALGAVTRTSCENLQKVFGLFLAYGLSCEEIVVISKKHPQILQYNPDSLEEKMEYLTEDMGREVRELLAFPAFLGYKLDDRIKHRYEAKKEVAGEGMSINKLLSVSTDRFSTKKKKLSGREK